jgi:hypothetical protein
MDEYFFVQKVSIFKKKSILGGVFLTNQHLLLLGGHYNQITLEAIKQAKELGLDMITLSLHTSHALQPLDVSCSSLLI